MNKAQYKANHAYRAKHYDRIEIQIPAGAKEKLKVFSENAGEKSLSSWIAGLIERETGIPLVLRGELPYWKPSEQNTDDNKPGPTE